MEKLPPSGRRIAVAFFAIASLSLMAVSCTGGPPSLSTPAGDPIPKIHPGPVSDSPASTPGSPANVQERSSADLLVEALDSIRPYKARGPLDQPQAKPVPPPRSDPRIVVLLYHNLVYGRTGSEYNRDLHNFELDLQFIEKNFEVIGFGDLEAIKTGKRPLLHDAVIISFDDGDLSMYAIAYPLLREYGMKAAFFIVPGFVGETGYMNWEQIEEIAGYRNVAGERLFELGSHTRTHIALGEAQPAELQAEIAGSRDDILARTGLEPGFLALPYGSGSENPEVRKSALAAGYRGIRSSDTGIISAAKINLLHIPSVLIDNSSSAKAMGKIRTLLGR